MPVLLKGPGTRQLPLPRRAPRPRPPRKHPPSHALLPALSSNLFPPTTHYHTHTSFYGAMLLTHPAIPVHVHTHSPCLRQSALAYCSLPNCSQQKNLFILAVTSHFLPLGGNGGLNLKESNPSDTEDFTERAGKKGNTVRAYAPGCVSSGCTCMAALPGCSGRGSGSGPSPPTNGNT